ncbi:MAG: hypothetical protein ABL973_14235 [Micropepsaceae bacterium]
MELIARDLLNEGLLPKSVGGAYAQFDFDDFGELILAVLATPRPTRAAHQLIEYRSLKPLTAKNKRELEVNRLAIEDRGLKLDLEKLKPFPNLGALFQADYTMGGELLDLIGSAIIHIDRSHPSAIVEWKDKTASVFGTLASGKDGDFSPYKTNVLPIEARWKLYMLVQAQLSFFDSSGGYAR